MSRISLAIWSSSAGIIINGTGGDQNWGNAALDWLFYLTTVDLGPNQAINDRQKESHKEIVDFLGSYNAALHNLNREASNLFRTQLS